MKLKLKPYAVVGKRFSDTLKFLQNLNYYYEIFAGRKRN